MTYWSDDVCDMSERFKTEWRRLRKHFGESLVLKDLGEAMDLKRKRWDEQGSTDRHTRVEAAKDIMRCSFTFKVFRMLKAYKTAEKTTAQLNFADWQKSYFFTFGQLMGDVPLELKAQGEWWLAERKTTKGENR